MLKFPSGSPDSSIETGLGSMIVPIQIDDKYRGWSGPAEQLAEIASTELKRSDPPGVGDGSDTQPELNERAIRYYVSMGVLDAPVRVGKESRYGLRHLLQLIAIRKLQRRRYSLSVIRDEVFRRVNWNDYDTVAQAPALARVQVTEPASKASYSAQRLVERFKQDAGLRTGKKVAATAAPVRVLRMRLSDWCEVLVTEEALSQMPADAPDRMAAALHQALLDEQTKRNRR